MKVVKLNSGRISFELQLKMINSLIENIFDTDLLKNLYKYTYGDFAFVDSITSNDLKSCTYTKIYCQDELITSLLKDTDLRDLFYNKIQQDIIKYRDLVEEKASIVKKSRKRGKRKKSEDKS